MLILSMRSPVDAIPMRGFLITTVAAVIFQALGAASVVVPSTSCYVLDNSSYIHDFSSWIGHHFEYEGDQSADLALRFCKDVEARSQMGYVDFGRFDRFNYFAASSGRANFVQEYYNGDLVKCEESFDKLGRTSQVNIICGDCSNGQCKGGGCICNVTYESTCRVLVELAMQCEKPGLRVFEGFTVGFNPRSWEIVYNGMTQVGYDKAYNEFSFTTEQMHVTLYMTAVASLSGLVRKPTIKISPEKGLEVKLSGSGANGSPPTTLSPTTILVDWRCEKARDNPYEVEFTIPIENYDPIQFTLAKKCEYRQIEGGESTRGWAIFGILSCVFIVGFTLFCCGGFIYKTRMESRHGLDALPGMSIISACLETVSGGGHNYARSGDANSPFVNQASWERPPTSSAQGSKRTGDRTYGSI
ncbi:uncharacterized protein LOC111397218 isoform X1 [Olea europaea var. sylvestris]|uniref:uncharacterized protein LOC111397218 isoform X1 n=1 Tax=Olea europaea var. sylvestris TaxID=158386 RepID=UPI000C1CE509|nr:uncharacterized protein LOC111397218 isoform X1 [Olea europaea var. sylvestris]